MTTRTTTKRTSKQVRASRPKSAAARRRAMWRAVGNFLTNRSRDLALCAIVLAAFVAVFEGSLYSATAFAFTGWSAYAFAVMPDALMVLSAAKMRQVGITAAQHHSAKVSMYYGLVFSLLTNMIAAFLKYAPADLKPASALLVGAVAYHGVVVIFLWRAVETLTKTRADRKGHKASEPAMVPATQARVTPPIMTRPASWAETALARLLGNHSPA